MGDSSAQTLEKFARYFPAGEGADKLLDRASITKLSRGILEQFRKLERERAFKEQLSNWYFVEGLTALGEIAVLTERSPADYAKTLREIFQRLFQLDPEQMRFYQGTFGTQRNEAAILTYLGKIRSLKPEERKGLEETFQRIIRGLLTENQALFYQERYDPKQSEHLTVVFGAKRDLCDRWVQNQAVSFNGFLKENAIIFKLFKPNYAEFLINKICRNHHLKIADYPFLDRYLNNLNNRKISKEVIQNLEEALKRLQESTAKESPKDPKESAEKEKAKDKNIKSRLQFQLALIQLAESSQAAALDVKEGKEKQESEQTAKAERIQKQYITEALDCLKKFMEGSEFHHDLRSLLKGFNAVKSPLDTRQSKDWQMMVTDHYWDLFMSGTDVEESCQRVDGDPELNKCLAAYVKDGKIKMIAIKDGSGKLIARCMLRLLWDEKARTPVLYLEESYPHFLRSEQVQAIEKFAVQLAKALDLPLVSAEATESSVKYLNPLVSLSGIGPEYVDAIYQTTERGVFIIPHSQVLWQPKWLHERLYPQSLVFAFKRSAASNSALGYLEAGVSLPSSRSESALEEVELMLNNRSHPALLERSCPTPLSFRRLLRTCLADQLDTNSDPDRLLPVFSMAKPKAKS